MDRNQDTEASLERKMNVIIALLLRIANSGKTLALKEQVRELSAFGLKSSEIADILGKKVGHVSKELSVLKRESK